MLSSSRDNWERLVAAVVKKNQIWELCHQNSMTTVSSNSPRNSNFSEEILSVSRSQSERFLPPPQPPPAAGASGLEAGKNPSGPITRKLFSALRWRRKPKDYNLGQGLVGIPEDHLGLPGYSQRELLVATDNFSNNNYLGWSGYDQIYKGRLVDGSLVAVKRLRKQVTAKELEITSTAAHSNVLRPRGFCITQNEQLVVYPYMVNGSVASWLRERDDSRPPLDWRTRKQIALGAAKGLAYLHYECPRKIIHHDVKAANILLDENFEAVVGDLHLGEFVDFCDNDVEIPIKGTMGHIAPEYCATSKCSVKNDVFDYGVFLLELITAQKVYDLSRIANHSPVLLFNWVKGNYEDGKLEVVVDADLQGDSVDEEVEELVQLALICTHNDPEERPTMLEVVWMLEFADDLGERKAEWYVEDSKGDNSERRDVESFNLDILQAATEDFSNKIISKDGFNMIYEGWLDGSPVAVKRYNYLSLEYYFYNELDIGRNCLHPNLVHVIGFCQTPEEQLLVFRLMVNGSVESWLRGRHESRPPLTWLTRKRIARGVANGLAYLHDKCEKKIVHGNVKAANILLDENFEPVVADFKTAEFMDHNETHITTTVRGTAGHIAPEFLASGKCSDKTDVFGYGAFLLELITGQRTIDLLDLADDEDMVLADWVKRNYEEREWELIVDKDSECNSMNTVVMQLVRMARLCTRHDPDGRPNMSEVVRMLGASCVAERYEELFKKEVGEGDGDGDDCNYDCFSLASNEEFLEPR